MVSKMYTIGRDNIEGYDFKAEESLRKWRGFFIPALQQIQKLTDPSLIAKEDALLYVESLILKLLNTIISANGSVGPGGSSMMTTLHTTSDVEDRIRRLIPDPLNNQSIQKAKEILAAMRNSKKIKAYSRFHGNDRSPLKTPVDKFHQMLQKDVLCYKTDIHVSQFLLAVLEFIATDILKLAGHYVRNMIHTEITSQDVRVAMCADKILMEIFYKDDEDDVEGPPLSANIYSHQSFFDSDFCDGENGTVGAYSTAVNEFIQEERQFIRELSLIIKVFRDPLSTVLSEDDLQNIFVNIDDIYEFSIKFLSLLEDAVEVGDDDDCPAIGSCFIEIAEEEEMYVFHKYAQNVMNFSFREHLNRVLSDHSLMNRITEIFSSRYSWGMIKPLRYVLPRLLLLPVYHCFSYFKAIEKLKELTPKPEDRENYEQADSTLQSLRNVLEKLKKSNKFGDGYFLRLYGRTHRATALATMKDIQNSIDNWNGKDIWQSCNEFIREGVLYKESGKYISSHLSSNRFFLTERRAFLFDSLLILCKPCNKRIVPGRSDNSQLEWRYKESFFIRNIEVNERVDPYAGSNFSLHGSLHNNFPSENSSSGYNSMLDQSLNNANSHSQSDSSVHFANAFEISETNRNQSIVLSAKTAEEKDSWMSQLILLNVRPMLERTLDAILSEEAKKHPLWLPHPSQYPFAIEDMETNIILEENKSNPNVPLIKGATLLKLVERLTYHKYGDPVLVRIFLSTFRSFCTPIELLKLLIKRFEIPEPDFRSCMLAMHYANDELSSPTSMAPPSQELNNSDTTSSNHNDGSDTGPTSPTSLSVNNLPSTPSDLNVFFDEQDQQCQQDYREMLKRFRKEYAQPVQFRVLNVLRHWVGKHYYDFERDSQLMDMLNEFLDEKLAKSYTKVAKWCRNIRNVIDRSKKLQKQMEQADTLSLMSIERPFSNLMIGEEFDLLNFSAKAIAQHLTLFEFELYRAVQPYEIIGTDDQSLVWIKKDKQKTSPNLFKIFRQTMMMTYYYEKCIVEAENFDERVDVMRHIVEIMIRLQEFNNFNGVFEIVSALESSPIHRLDHTKAQLERNSKLKKAIEAAKDLQSDHLKKYKEKLFSINPPCVPFLGNFLTNIVHLEEGNPLYLPHPNNDNISTAQQNNSNSNCTNDSMTLNDLNDQKLINFHKKRRVAEIMTQIQQYQNTPYNFKPFNPTIMNFFQNINSIVFPDWDEDRMIEYLYNKSMEIEPRGCRQPPKFPQKRPNRNSKQQSKSRNTRLLGLPGLSHQSQSSISSHHNGGHHSHQNSISSHFDSVSISDMISLKQQQSPSTPSTPPGVVSGNNHSLHDAVFAPVMIGGGSYSPSPSLHTAMSFFPSNAPPPAPGSPPSCSNNSSIHHIHRHSLSSPLSPPGTSDFLTCGSATTSPSAISSQHQDQPPPLPPRNSALPPPLPPRTYRRTLSGNNSSTISSVGRMSYRDKGPPALPRIPSSSSHFHQRGNSDITCSSSSTTTSPKAANGGPTFGVGMIVRQNSSMENTTTLPPRRYSQGQQPPPPPPPPPPLPPTPLATPSQSMPFFNNNVLPGNGTSGHQHQSSPLSSPLTSSMSVQQPPLPPLPISASSSSSSSSSSTLTPMRPPPISPSITTTGSGPTVDPGVVPELPPKTYQRVQ